MTIQALTRNLIDFITMVVPPRRVRYSVTPMLASAATGVGLMYFLDKTSGARRRAMVKDAVVRTGHGVSSYVEKATKDIGNRVQGMVAEARSAILREPVSDDKLEQRVRSKLGRYVSHPSAIQVQVRSGEVELKGPILEQEVQQLLAAIEKVRGVQAIDNDLQAHASADNVPELQDGREAASGA